MLLLPLMVGFPGCAGPSADSPDDTEPEDTGVEVIEDDSAPDTEDTGDTDDTDDRDELLRYEALYDLAVVQRIDLTLSVEALEALRADPATYVSGAFTCGGEVLENVGIRLRGSPASRDLDAKPSFKVRLNEFEPGQRYGGVERVVLDNMVDDPSQAREVFAYSLWAEAGLFAPRANYAQVWVNGEPFGLYANVEAVDDRFLRHHVPDDGGDLWKGNDSADFTQNGVDHFERVSGEGGEDALDAARRAVWAGGEFTSDVAGVIDLEQFLDYWAWNIAVGNNDAYPYDLNDFDIYADPADDRFDFTLHGLGRSWDTGLEWDAARGALGYRCVYDEACVALLRDHARTALDLYEAQDRVAAAEVLFALTESAVVDDPRRPSTPGEVIVARSLLSTRLDAWPTHVRIAMAL